MKRKQNAFTLIELLVVIAIIAILAISIAVGYQSVRKSANDAKRVETARSIHSAENLYANANNNKYTDSIDELVEDDYLSSDPDTNLNIGPDAERDSITWDQWLITRNSNNDYYVLVRKSDGEYFCCNTDGCQDNLSSSQACRP